MNKKVFITLSLFSFVFSLVSCGGTKTFEQMLNDLKGDSITLNSDHMFYWYDKDTPNEKNPIAGHHHDVEAKVSLDAYSVKAYLSGTDTLSTSINLTKDEDGKTVYNYLTIKNEITYEYALNSLGRPISWENSVYNNTFNKFALNDFEQIDENTYKFKGSLNGVVQDLIHCAVPTSYFQVESCIFKIKNNKIDSVVIQEVEDKEMWKEENQVFGRVLTIYPSNVNSTKADVIKPYPSNEETNDLGIALDELRSAKSYEVVSEAYKDDSTKIELQRTIITENDIYQKVRNDMGYYTYQGIHKYNNDYYSFLSTGEYLLGEKLSSNDNIENYFPKFDFSKDILFYKETNSDGYKVYEVRANMQNAINDIDFASNHAGDYYNGAGNIYFFVKNQHLAYVEFPIFLQEGESAVLYTERLTYKNIDNSSIDDSIWETFVTEIPEDDEAHSWDDESLRFEINLNGEKVSMTPSDVFEKTLGDRNAIVFFLPRGLIYTIEGDCYTKEVTIEMGAKGAKENQVLEAIEMLTSSGYQKKGSNDPGMILYELYKDDHIISVLFDKTTKYLEIIIGLPLGNILD